MDVLVQLSKLALIDPPQSFFGLGGQTTVDFLLEGQDKRRMVEIASEGGIQQLLVYSDSEPVKGQVRVRPSKKMEHLGLKVALIGDIGTFFQANGSLCHFFFLVALWTDGGETIVDTGFLSG